MKQFLILIVLFLITGVGCIQSTENMTSEQVLSDTDITTSLQENKKNEYEKEIIALRDKLVIVAVELDGAFYGIPILPKQRSYYDIILASVRDLVLAADEAVSSQASDEVIRSTIATAEAALASFTLELQEVRVSSVYSGTFSNIEQEDNSCITQYLQDKAYGTFSFSYPCDWEVEKESGYIRVWSPDKKGYIKYPGYALSHVEPYNTKQQTITTSQQKRFSVLSIFDEKDLPVTYDLFSPMDGVLNTINSEEIGRDNNNIHVKYSDAYRDEFEHIVASFNY